MALLNEDATSPGMGHKMFVHPLRRLRIEASTQLFKFTGNPLMTGGSLSPWWAFVDSGPLGDPGLDGVLRAIRLSGQLPEQFVREWFAVMTDWNTLKISQSGFLRIQRIRLLSPVFGFYGPCQRVHDKNQPLAHPTQDQSILPGGAMQLCIPGLTGTHAIGVGLDLIS
jgi:hypothetical protein